MDLGTMFLKSLQSYSTVNSLFKKYYDENVENSQDLELSSIYMELAKWLMNPDHTLEIASYFPHLLPKILKWSLDVVMIDSGIENALVQQQICIVLAKLISHSACKRYIQDFFCENKFGSLFNITNEESSPSKAKIPKLDKNIFMPSRKYTVLEIIEACYKLLRSSPDFFVSNWNWATFCSTFSENEDPEVKRLYMKCFYVLLKEFNSSDENRRLKQLTGEQLEDLIIKNQFGLKKEQDLYVSGIYKHAKRDNIPVTNEDILPCHPISGNMIDIGGICLPINKDKDYSHYAPSSRLILVPSTLATLRRVALTLSSDPVQAICLVGPVGCGKTAIVEDMAATLRRPRPISVQMGDQTDARTLLGLYTSTDVPGEFIWQAGVLTQAVMEGNWILLEDIDSASSDVASILSSLLENGKLNVPGYKEDVPITPGFQLFLTQRLLPSVIGLHKKHTSAINFLEKYMLQIKIDPLLSTELQKIICKSYPPLGTISNRMIQAFETVLTHYSTKLTKTERPVSIRDLFKWCNRAIINYDVTNKDCALKVLQDAIDIFCCASMNKQANVELAREIAKFLNITKDKADHFCRVYKPVVTLGENTFSVGRANFELKPRSSPNKTNRTPFCFTRPAACLLERIMCSVQSFEPVLLVGETGTGKTSVVQYLAQVLGQKLVVINMNQQSDSADLLGGFKPVDLEVLIKPIKLEFETLLRKTFKVELNKKMFYNLEYTYSKKRWSDLVTLMNHSCQTGMKRLTEMSSYKIARGSKRSLSNPEVVRAQKAKDSLKAWRNIDLKLEKLTNLIKTKSAMAFKFIEGSLVNAVRNGDWVLLDEINLANAETLECLSSLLEGSNGSLSLVERGDKKPITRHSNFTLFACMNPSTDIGKRDLPTGIRSRFTELFLEELTEKTDLLMVTNNYLKPMALSSNQLERIVDLYLRIKNEADGKLCDGQGQKPHYSLRSLCRALSIAARNPCGGSFQRNIYESCCLSFLTQLNEESYKMVHSLIVKHIFTDDKERKMIMNQALVPPKVSTDKSTTEWYKQVQGYWVPCGPVEPNEDPSYVLTDTVKRNLRDLVRVVAIGNLPVLIQGSTSIGKTSLVTYLAKATGNKCVRINNHEHTDLQEYIGTYVADDTGKLVFREGLLVEAMRQGHWIILDELNLAPTDVLEALNRLLDDNRELYLTETQETVKAKDGFKLFATQNPPGLYAGRKPLSRAFRNRFAELHWADIPIEELKQILHLRCQLPLTTAKRCVNIAHQLQLLRRESAAFAGKEGFLSMRDLFRWGDRYRLATVGENLEKPQWYDWDQHMTDEGYILLAGRVRKSCEREQIASILTKYFKRSIVPDNLYTLSDNTSPVTRHILESLEREKMKHPNIVWTNNMRRLAVHTAKAMEFQEPVLLVGETGCGKTTVCQILANDKNQELTCVNCHMHTESSDFIGGLRPAREQQDIENSKLFEWADGPLIKAMNEGHIFLADEISLADDSVLERLNSLLEPERSLLLAEKGVSNSSNKTNSKQLIVAHKKFHFIGTMNPGGDFGKKELSPALRNRFTEIWCEPCEDRNDLIEIIEHNLLEDISLGNQENGLSGIGENIVDFIEWLKETDIGKRFTITIRDILSWVHFINACKDKIAYNEAYIHGALLTFLDALGTGSSSTESSSTLTTFHTSCISFLSNQLVSNHLSPISPSLLIPTNVSRTLTHFGIHPFFLPLNMDEDSTKLGGGGFNLDTPTSLYNAQRVLRALSGALGKPILLEGSPGVGKTSLVVALAKETGNQCVRINLSDQTDISDLFGADLPVEGGLGGEFSWRDGPFLQALKSGFWILLDELNLATQSVLEGLNACFDHRGEVYIPELDRTFQVKPNTKLFACQNPLHQGSGRRGLPQSFLNRFTSVHLHALTSEDFNHILRAQFPKLPDKLIVKMVQFNERLVKGLEEFKWGSRGGPWEMNLRDLVRWCEVTNKGHGMEESDKEGGKDKNFFDAACATASIIYCDCLRTQSDRDYVQVTFSEVFGCSMTGFNPTFYQTEDKVYFGDITVNTVNRCGSDDSSCVDSDDDESVAVFVGPKESSLVLREQCSVLRSLVYGVKMGWMTILVGSAGSGKTSVVKTLARLTGKTLHTLPVTSAMDTTDILGGFEQTDYNRHLEQAVRHTERIVYRCMRRLLKNSGIEIATELLHMWEGFRTAMKQVSVARTMSEETKLFLTKLDQLNAVLTRLTTDNQNQCVSIKDKDTIVSIQSQVQTIEANVRRERTLNAGGKFEWVDSVLIKCLQEGSWLIVDNVNLCSAAVLDRLNGLLEPNGVLTIGERGVDAATGLMTLIRPHKNFRLFFTMDPKNGEISRAMRNRGLQINILNEKELDCEVKPKKRHDIKSLINLRGLYRNREINCLLTIHKFITELVLGEKPNINHLLLSCFLIHQQINHGITIEKAFTDAILDTYYRSRSKSDFNILNPEQAIIELIQSILSDGNFQEKSSDFNSLLTIRTGDVKSSRKLEQIQYQSVLYEDELNQTNCDLEMLQQYLIQSIMMSSKSDFGLRMKYLTELSKKKENWSVENTLNLESFSKSSEPFDVRFTPDFISSKNNVNLSQVNKIYLRCYYISHKDLFELKSESAVWKKNKNQQFSILQYITSVAIKKCQNKIDDPVISNVYNLLKCYDEFILQNILAQDGSEFTNEMVIQIISMLQYKIYFYHCLKQQISYITQNVLDILTRNVHVHYKWFIKHAVKELAKLTDTKENLCELNTIVTKINMDLTDYFTILKKIAKHYAKLDHRPPPLINTFQLEFYEEFSKIYYKFDVYDKGTSLVSSYYDLMNNTLRMNLMQVIKNSSFDMDETFASFDELKLNVREIEAANDAKNLPSREEVTILPVVDFICVLNCYNIRNNLLQVSTNSLNKSITVPLKLIGLIEKTDRLNRYEHEILYEFAKYFVNSTAICPNKCLDFQKDAEEDEKSEEICLNTHGCVLSYLINKITVASPESDEVFIKTTMGNYKKVKEQRSKVLSLLWSNYYQLNSKKYDVISNEIIYLKQSYINFLTTFAKSLDIDTPPTKANILQKINSLYQDCLLSQEYLLIKDILTKLEEQLTSIESTDENVQLNSISNLYILLNYFKVILNTKLSIIDPLTKVGLKKKYCLMERDKFEKIKTAFHNQCDVVMSTDNYLHPYCTEIDKKIIDLDRKNLELGNYVAVRPSDVSYDSIYKKINDSLKTVLSPNKLFDIYGRSNTFLNELQLLSMQEINKIFIEVKTFFSNLDTFMGQLKVYQYSYPDVIQPILTNVSEILYGLKLKLDILKKIKQEKIYKANNLDAFEERVLLQELMSGVSEISCEKVANCIKTVLKNEEGTILEKREVLRLSIINIKYFYNLCLIETKYSQRINTKLFQKFSSFVEDFINEWKVQEEIRKAKEIEEESLYKTKTKAYEKSDEEQMSDEFKILFPSFHDKDFSDMQTKNLEDDFNQSTIDETQTNGFHGIITIDHVFSITTMHLNLIDRYTKTMWLNPNISTFKIDSIGLFLEKYKLFALILNKSVDALNSNVDKNHLADVQIFLNAACHFGDTNYLDPVTSPTKTAKNITYNFYKDTKIDEITSGIFVLEELVKKINSLLEEWPEHPALSDIMKIITRVLSFDITSPVSRFLTGFEILLTKCHEWEENAHSGVSLSEHIQPVISIIIQWRKIELNMWKDCLNQTLLRLNEPISKWWCHLYDIMLQFTQSGTISNEELIESIQKFMFQSNLAEFANRVKLLKVFHSHVACLETTTLNETFMNILWNMFTYFEQFVRNVEIKIKELRVPIEKKLKDYVKIVRWKDVSYWAIKATLEKTQKTLHQYMKEFEIEIKALANPCFTINANISTISSNTGIWDRPQRSTKVYHYTLSSQSYLANKQLVQKISTNTNANTTLNKSPKYFEKSLKICKFIIESTKYPNLIKQLDGSIGIIIDTSEYLQNLEVDRTLERAKQISQSKGHLQQKQRELATLFKTLTSIGLSYRRGIIQSKAQNETPKEYLLKPVDLDAGLNHLHQHSSFNANDQKILTMWNGVETYYTNSLIRLQILNNSLNNPSKDLGMQNIERCRGFGYELMNYSIQQKEQLIESCNYFYNLRYYNTILNDFCEGKKFIPTKELDAMECILKETFFEMEHLKLLLNSCPEEPVTSEDLFNGLPILNCENTISFIKHKNDDIWKKTFSSLTSILTSCDKVLTKIQSVKNYIPSILYEKKYLLFNDFDWLLKEMQNIMENLIKINKVFDNVPCGDKFKLLLEKYKKIITGQHDETSASQNIENLTENVQSIMERCMLIFQEIFKKYTDSSLKLTTEKLNTNEETLPDDEEEVHSKLEDNHFKQELIQSLFDDCAKLQMDKLSNLVINLANSLTYLNPQEADEVKAVISNILPSLEQTILLIQYFFTQQVSAYRVSCKLTSILLNIFINLSTKGFCIPPDLASEMQKELEGKQTGGMGLGEGEGEKDVSDRIESEDQLEDAIPEGQEKKKDKNDKECPEEEKGIEMSDDFNAELQDVDQKDKDSNDESDNSDAEEQMGDTQDDAEQLDQEIWGSDTEEIDEENTNQEKDDQKGDKGETIGEEKLAANEERSADTEEKQDDKERTSTEQDKEINEMEEKELDEDQIDPYHGNQPELPEPEAFDLPENMDLDDGKDGQEDGPEEENPFDIDTMKEQNISEEPQQEDVTNDEVKDDNVQSENDEDDSADAEDNQKTEEEKNDDQEGVDEEKQDEGLKNVEEDNVEEENVEDNQKSGLDTKDTNEEAQAMDVDDVQTADNVETTASKNDQSTQPNEQTSQENNPDKDGVGQSQSEETATGHKGKASTGDIPDQKKPDTEDVKRKRQKPGESNEDRTLGDSKEPVQKRVKTIKDIDNANTEEENEEAKKGMDTEEYQHIKDAKESANQVLDTATQDQAKEEQSKVHQQREVTEEEEAKESLEDLPVDDTEEIGESTDVAKEAAQKLTESTKDADKSKQLPTDIEDSDQLEPMKMDIEGEFVQTQTVRRGGDSSYHTHFQSEDLSIPIMTKEQMLTLKQDIEKQIAEWQQIPSDQEAATTWEKIKAVTYSLAQSLSEQLRIVLEPTQASRLRGDFRTGRRINMRKVIPYIASQFRKDKIWLRRTKPSKREYQIVLAIDDSSSMHDNHAKELAFESVAVISKALTLLESGQVSVLSFGEKTKVVHRLTDTFTDYSGCRLIQEFQFKQNKTCIANLVDFATEMLNESATTNINSLLAKLLVIISDGRGIFSEGEQIVQQAVRRAKQSNIFMVFVIVDSMNSSESILDIRMTKFEKTEVKISQYMDEFPFPFYIILQDLNSLPNVLSDALRQWFEMVTNTDR